MSRSDRKNEGIKLSASQIRAVEALLHGQTMTAAAKSAGISRETLHRWQRENFAFQAIYNEGRRELLNAIQSRLLALADKATETVTEAIEQGDTKAALALLKGLGMLPGSPIRIGTDDPHILRQDSEIAEKEAHSVRREREMYASLGCGSSKL